MSFEGYGILPEFRTGRAQLFSKLSKTDHVRQSVLLLLTVRRGERPLSPYFGHQLHTFLFMPNSPGLQKQIEQHVHSLIGEQEPRARDVSVQVETSKRDPTVLQIGVRFRTEPNAGMVTVKLALNLQGEPETGGGHG